jgi:hypothetical protein
LRRWRILTHVAYPIIDIASFRASASAACSDEKTVSMQTR